jgi:RimJ/RimL family protein N-acetyltransferase
MNIPTLSTTRLVLRPITVADLEPLFLIQNDTEVVRYFPNPVPPPRERVLKTIQQQLEHWDKFGYGWWVVELKNNQALIGWAGLQYLPETGESEVAYLLGKSYWGKGLATEAARASLEFGFQNTLIQSFIGIVHLDNIASQKVLTNIGMSLVDKTNYFGMDCFRYRIDRPLMIH